MANKKYKVRRKTSANDSLPAPKKSKTGYSAKQRMLLLLLWGAVCIWLYMAVARVSFFFSLWIFIIIFVLAFIFYFISSIKVARLTESGKGESSECIKLIDRGKLLLIIMIPPLFVIMYDFVSSTIKMFM